MGIFSSISNAVKKVRNKVTKAVSSTVSKVTSAVKSTVSKASSIATTTSKKLRKTASSAVSTASSVYKAVDTKAGGYLPGGVSPTAAKTSKLRKSASEKTQLSEAEATVREIDRNRDLDELRGKELQELEEAKIKAEYAEAIAPYSIREDLATQGFLEIPSSTERSLRKAQEAAIGAEMLADFSSGYDYSSSAGSAALGQLFAEEDKSTFGDEVKKVGTGLGVVLLGAGALIGLSKLGNKR